jgi:hypothetical protein
VVKTGNFLQSLRKTASLLESALGANPQRQLGQGLGKGVTDHQTSVDVGGVHHTCCLNMGHTGCEPTYQGKDLTKLSLTYSPNDLDETKKEFLLGVRGTRLFENRILIKRR